MLGAFNNEFNVLYIEYFSKSICSLSFQKHSSKIFLTSSVNIIFRDGFDGRLDRIHWTTNLTAAKIIVQNPVASRGIFKRIQNLFPVNELFSVGVVLDKIFYVQSRLEPAAKIQSAVGI